MLPRERARRRRSGRDEGVVVRETEYVSITDPIADMLTRIRNANTANHKTVDIPASRAKQAIAQILARRRVHRELRARRRKGRRARFGSRCATAPRRRRSSPDCAASRVPACASTRARRRSRACWADSAWSSCRPRKASCRASARRSRASEERFLRTFGKAVRPCRA